MEKKHRRSIGALLNDEVGNIDVSIILGPLISIQMINWSMDSVVHKFIGSLNGSLSQWCIDSLIRWCFWAHWFIDSCMKSSMKHCWFIGSIRISWGHWLIGFMLPSESLIGCLIESLNRSTIDSLTHWLTVVVSVNDWFIDPLICWFWFAVSIHCFADSSVHRLAISLILLKNHSFSDPLIHYFTDSILIHWIFISSLVHSVSCAHTIYFMPLASPPPLAHSWMHRATSTPHCFP